MTPRLRPLTNDDERLARFWHPVARIDALAPGTVRRVELLGEPLVVARLTPDDEILIAPDRCVHRAARLSLGAVVDGCLRCAYHGWRFGPDGTCTAIPALGADGPIPARAALAVLPVARALGLVWTCIHPPVGPGAVEAVSDADARPDADLVTAWLPDVVVGCTAAHFVDNFCDIAHFPFVHTGTFGADESERIDDLAVERDGPHSVRLRHTHTVANREDPLVSTGEHPLLQPRQMEYRWTAPFTVSLDIRLPLTGVRNTIVAVASPTNATTTTLFTALWRNDIDGPDTESARRAVAYELSVLTEDLKILENLAEPTFALELPAQVHTRADRFTVEIRRVLAEVIGPGLETFCSPTGHEPAIQSP